MQPVGLFSNLKQEPIGGIMKKDRPKMGPKEAGQKGGQVTAQRHGPHFYSQIGQKGGQAVSQNRQHMSKIGQRGGKASSRRRSSD